MFIETEERLQGEVKLDEASTLLLKAADHLKRLGWCQDAINADGRLCLIGALAYAETSASEKPSTGYVTARSKLLRYLNTESLIDWNDTPGRTREEVITKLRATAFSTN